MMMEKSLQFQKEMYEIITNIQRNPGAKQKLFEKLQVVHAQYEEEKGRQGLLCGEEARMRLI